MDKKKTFIVIGVFWLVLLGGLVAMKEYTLQIGSEVLLRTQPVDPRDLFRGDYVILSYDLSIIGTGELARNASDYEVGAPIFVSLNLDGQRVGTVKNIFKSAPNNEVVFLRGTVKNVYADQLRVEYGIESYFVPEGEGRVIERDLGEIYMKVAIDRFGNAVIKSLIMNDELR